MKQPEAVVLGSEGRRSGLCPARRRAGRRTSGRFAYQRPEGETGGAERSRVAVCRAGAHLPY